MLKVCYSDFDSALQWSVSDFQNIDLIPPLPSSHGSVESQQGGGVVPSRISAVCLQRLKSSTHTVLQRVVQSVKQLIVMLGEKILDHFLVEHTPLVDVSHFLQLQPAN